MTRPIKLYERVLVVRCQAGDEAALAELVERYQQRLGYYLRKMLAGTTAAEDAAQDVWYDVVRALPRLANPAAFRSWLYRIAGSGLANSPPSAAAAPADRRRRSCRQRHGRRIHGRECRHCPRRAGSTGAGTSRSCRVALHRGHELRRNCTSVRLPARHGPLPVTSRQARLRRVLEGINHE